MDTNRIFKKIQSLLIRIRIKLIQKTYNGRLKYLFFNNDSDTIIVLFSGFTGESPKYNYVKCLNSLPIDRLYILDDFGYMGSYYWYENSSDHPRRLTEGLLKMILSRGYKHVCFAGSSKGGTCSIFYGLQFNAEIIISGACQYNVGQYVHRLDNEKIFLGMMGSGAGEKEAILLDKMMPRQFEKYSGSSSTIHLIYSKNELTYERQIVDLLKKGKECNLRIVEHEEYFTNHGDIGLVFPSWLHRILKRNDSIS